MVIAVTDGTHHTHSKRSKPPPINTSTTMAAAGGGAAEATDAAGAREFDIVVFGATGFTGK